MVSVKEPIAGKYSGQVRGRKTSVTIGVLPYAITYFYLYGGEEKIDTLRTYIGSNTWMKDNNTIEINEEELRLDQIYGYYILKKE